MLTVSHAVTHTVAVSADPDRCQAVLARFMALFESLPDVSSVESYGGGIYRVILKKMGIQLGAIGYGVHLAYDMRFEVLDDGVRAVTLERDPYDSWIGDGILLADCRSETRVKALAEGSELTHVIDLRVQVQVPTLLALAPRKVVQDLADALMRRKTESFTDDMLGCLKRALA